MTSRTLDSPYGSTSQTPECVRITGELKMQIPGSLGISVEFQESALLISTQDMLDFEIWQRGCGWAVFFTLLPYLHAQGPEPKSPKAA